MRLNRFAAIALSAAALVAVSAPFAAHAATSHDTTAATAAPSVAIALQGVVAMIIAASGRYEQILNYVTSVDFILFGMTGIALLVFRHRQPASDGFRTPGHPITTVFFVVSCFLVVASTILKYPANSAIGLAILLTGVPVYFFWRKRTP